MTSLPDLIREAQAGSEEATNRLLSLLRHPVCRAAARVLRSQDLAEDCAQETLLILHRKLQELDPRDNVVGYARWIATRRATHLLRCQARIVSLDSLANDPRRCPASAARTPLHQLAEAEEDEQRLPRIRAKLDRFQASLSGVALRGFVARREGLSDRQLAERHGVLVDTARSWKFRCLRGKAA